MREREGLLVPIEGLVVPTCNHNHFPLEKRCVFPDLHAFFGRIDKLKRNLAASAVAARYLHI
jgi:hypothetical protein